MRRIARPLGQFRADEGRERRAVERHVASDPHRKTDVGGTKTRGDQSVGQRREIFIRSNVCGVAVPPPPRASGAGDARANDNDVSVNIGRSYGGGQSADPGPDADYVGFIVPVQSASPLTSVEPRTRGHYFAHITYLRRDLEATVDADAG